jgi:protein O-GlcNAc transferase
MSLKNSQTDVEIDKKTDTVEKENDLSFTYSLGLLEWFKHNKCGIVSTSYKTNMVYSMGLVKDTDGIEKFSLWYNWFHRPTAVGVYQDHLYLSLNNSIAKFSNTNSMEKLDDGFDCSFVPMITYNTNNIDGHDFVFDHNGKLIFANTKFSCISSLSDTYNFNVEYVPPWISRVAPEDRSHLNGLCLDAEGKIKYITCVCDSDVQDGWRKRRGEADGFVFDVQEGKKICENLTMPHSPRLYDGKLWVLNSGKGELGYIEDGKFVPFVFIPGFLRGLDFIGKYAVIGSSMDRHEGRFSDLILGKILEEKKIEARCGVYIVDMTNGFILHNVEYPNAKEMYDVKIVKNVRRPRVISVDNDISQSNYRMPKIL